MYLIIYIAYKISIRSHYHYIIIDNLLHIKSRVVYQLRNYQYYVNLCHFCNHDIKRYYRYLYNNVQGVNLYLLNLNKQKS